MELTEQQIANAFGAELPQGETAPAAETAPEQNAEQAAEQTAEQTADERHENAARRRRQEQQAAIDEAVKTALAEREKKYQEEQDKLFADMGLKNTINNEPIRSREDFYGWKKEFDARKLDQNLKAGKLTKDQLDTIIEQNETVIAAKEIVKRNEEEKRQQQNRQAQAQMDAEIAEIGKIDENIHSLEDLANAPYAEEFRKYVMRGFTFKEAFMMCTYDDIQNATAEAARNSARLNSRGKDHLHTGSNSRGAGAVSVPPAELAMFKLFNPNATPEEIQNYYNKTKK